MNKKYLQIIAAFMINLILVLPIAFAELTNPKVYGEDMLEGYIRDDADLISFEVNAKINDEVIEPSQIRLWGTDSETGFEFTSCSLDYDGSYYCYLDSLDLDEYGLKVCPNHVNDINLYYNGDLYDRAQVEVVCDSTEPEIVKFETNKAVYNTNDTVEFTFSIKEKADAVGKCSGIMGAILEVGDYSEIIEINSDPGSCDYNGNISINASLLLEDNIEARLTVYDTFGLSSSKSVNIITDFSGPDITNIKITKPDGTDIGYYIENELVDVKVTVEFTDDSGIDAQKSVLNINDLDVINKAATSCNATECSWVTKIKMKNTNPTITVTLKDLVGNYNSEDMPYSFIEDTISPVISNFKLTDSRGNELDWNNGKNVKVVLEVEIIESESGLDENKVKADLSALNEDYGEIQRSSCSTQGNGSVCKWSVAINLESETSKQVSFKFYAADRSSNEKEQTFSYKLLVDNKEPVFSNFVSDKVFDSKYFIGKDTLITASINEIGVGLNESNIYLNLNEVGLDNVNADNCTNGWTCYWNIEAKSNNGNKVMVTLSGEDKLGNVGTNIEKEFTVDIRNPVINSVNTLPEFPTYKDTLIFNVNVTEKNLLKVEINTTSISETGSVEIMECGDYEGIPNMHECYLEVGDLKTEYTSANVNIIATDAAGNKAVRNHNAVIYTLETRNIPDFFYIQQPVIFVPRFIDKQAASKIPISVFLNPRISVKSEYNNQRWDPQILTKAVDCSKTDHLSNTGYLMNEYTLTPYIVVKTATSITGVDEETFPIDCNMTLRVKAGQKVYSLPEYEGVKVEVPLYNIPLGTIEDNVQDKIEDLGKEIEELDKKIETEEEYNDMLNLLCTIARNIAQIDALLQGILTVITELTSCPLETTIVGEPLAEATHKSACIPLNSIHNAIRFWIWDPRLLPIPPTPGYFFKWTCMIHSGYLCNANALGHTMLTIVTDLAKPNSIAVTIPTGLSGGSMNVNLPLKGSWNAPGSRTNVEGIIEPSYWTYDPYKSIYYSEKCLFLPGIIYNQKKLRQIKCMQIKCVHENSKLGLPIDTCDRAFGERYCLYYVSAQYKLHGHSWGKWFENIWSAMLKDKVQLVLSILGLPCLIWDYTAVVTECPLPPCAVFPHRICSGIATIQTIKNVVDIVSSGIIIKPYTDELEGYDYCEDIDDYI